MVSLSMTLNDLWPVFQGHNILWSRISEKRHVLKTKLLLDKRKVYLTYGTMFGDLDWPLKINASRGFVSISWASCFITCPIPICPIPIRPLNCSMVYRHCSLHDSMLAVTSSWTGLFSNWNAVYKNPFMPRWQHFKRLVFLAVILSWPQTLSQ